MGKLEDSIKAYGREIGFDIVGITTAESFVRDEQAAVQRIRQGLMDGLDWYTEERVRRATHPEVLLPGARSVISLAMSYLTDEAQVTPAGPAGRIARYARGNDYHAVLKERLKQFVAALTERVGREVKTRIFVDDGPMNDRAAAERAGVGWFGKNTNILTRATAPGSSWPRSSQTSPSRRTVPCRRTAASASDASMLPHRRHRRALRHRRQALHLVPDHRAARADPPGAASPGRRLGLRLRHLPGRLSGEPGGDGQPRAGLRHGTTSPRRS